MRKKHKQTNISQACGEQVASKIQPEIQHPQLKLALDAHAASIVAVRMLDGAGGYSLHRTAAGILQSPGLTAVSSSVSDGK